MLTNFYVDMTAPVDEGRAVDIVCSDFRMPFNTICHKIHIEKLVKNRLGEQTRRWTDPQRTLILQFNSFINDLNDGTECTLGQVCWWYQMGLALCINHFALLRGLQKWTERNLLKFNKKCTWGVTSWKLSWQKRTWGSCELPCCHVGYHVECEPNNSLLMLQGPQMVFCMVS